MIYKWALKDTCRLDRNTLREYVDGFCDRDLPAFLNVSKLVRVEAFQTVLQFNEVDLSIMPQHHGDGLVRNIQAYIDTNTGGFDLMSNIHHASAPIRRYSDFTAATALQHLPQCTNLQELTLDVYTKPDYDDTGLDDEIPRLFISDTLQLVEIRWDLGWDPAHWPLRKMLYHNMVRWADKLCSGLERMGFEDNEVVNDDEWEWTWIMRRGTATASEQGVDDIDDADVDEQEP